MPPHHPHLSAVATVYPVSDDSISFLSKQLLGGEIVAVPTETVYGLAANAFDAEACARIFEAKQRPAFDPLIVHLPIGYDWAKICEPSPLLPHLAEAFWPGPLTVVLPKNPAIPGVVTSGLDSVAIRVPRHPVFQRLLSACNCPLAAPSANPFGYVSPTTAAHVQESLGDRISYILDGGPCEIGLESTILDIRDPEQPKILRPGSILAADLEQVLGKQIGSAKTAGQKGVMPGQLDRHYSPQTQALLREKISPSEPGSAPKTAFLFYTRPPNLAETKNVFWLSETGDSIEAARRLFDLLREIDRGGFEKLVAEKAPDSGLGIAINDRLRRATASE